ncbi:hypothetical protein ACSVIJ_24950, partial [Pseudomonas sp. NCHU5208]|uniref:hypothetical protein n=1 Tax=Pseudomonas sp. NCHU5208 TaxID=3451354 RepID=UPI003F97C55D
MRSIDLCKPREHGCPAGMKSRCLQWKKFFRRLSGKLIPDWQYGVGCSRCLFRIAAFLLMFLVSPSRASHFCGQ